MAAPGTRREIETLVGGESVAKKINQELTYRDLYGSIDNLWSVLFATGYLTQGGEPDGDVYRLRIPNLEIRKIFADQILEADAGAVEAGFNACLSKTISIRDTAVRKARKENFCHGILLGLLGHRGDWYVRSNAESGDGYSDILVETEEGVGVVIEVKYPDGGDLDAGCQEALAQIEKTGYEEALVQDGMETILKYGVACDRKKCRVKLGNGT